MTARGEIERLASLVRNYLHARGIGREGGIERRGRGADIVALLDPVEGAGERLPREEWLVPLQVDDDVEPRELGSAGGLRHPIGSAQMPRVGEYRAHLRPLDHFRHHR